MTINDTILTAVGNGKIKYKIIKEQGKYIQLEKVGGEMPRIKKCRVWQLKRNLEKLMVPRNNY